MPVAWVFLMLFVPLDSIWFCSLKSSLRKMFLWFNLLHLLESRWAWMRSCMVWRLQKRYLFSIFEDSQHRWTGAAYHRVLLTGTSRRRTISPCFFDCEDFWYENERGLWSLLRTAIQCAGRIKTLHIIHTSCHALNLQDTHFNTVKVCISMFPLWGIDSWTSGCVRKSWCSCQRRDYSIIRHTWGPQLRYISVLVWMSNGLLVIPCSFIACPRSRKNTAYQYNA